MKLRSILICLILPLFILSAKPVEIYEEKFTVRGKVIDKNELSMKKIPVKLFNEKGSVVAEKITDRKGRFKFKKVKRGTYVLRSYDQKRNLIAIKTFTIKDQDLELFLQPNQEEKKIEKERLAQKNKINPEEVSFFMGHQANLRMLKSAVSRIGIDESKHLYNVDVRGNQGGAGAPAVLSENWDLYKSGDLIVVAVVGSGLTWGAAILKKT